MKKKKSIFILMDNPNTIMDVLRGVMLHYSGKSPLGFIHHWNPPEEIMQHQFMLEFEDKKTTNIYYPFWSVLDYRIEYHTDKSYEFFRARVDAYDMKRLWIPEKMIPPEGVTMKQIRDALPANIEIAKIQIIDGKAVYPGLND